MRRILVLAAAAATGLAAWRKMQQTKAEQRLWAEATDRMGPKAAASRPGPET